VKKCWILLLSLLLAGCSKQTALETVNDEYVQPVSAPVWQIVADLPADAGVQVMESQDLAKLYLCDDYTVTVQTLSSGDLDRTLRTVTGYSREQLNPIRLQQGELQRYECVFVSAGEGQTQVGRTCILDDGNYHYVLTAMAGESQIEELTDTWKNLFDSFRLVEPDAELNTGS
jgi:hypothetical protein